MDLTVKRKVQKKSNPSSVLKLPLPIVGWEWLPRCLIGCARMQRRTGTTKLRFILWRGRIMSRWILRGLFTCMKKQALSALRSGGICSSCKRT